MRLKRISAAIVIAAAPVFACSTASVVHAQDLGRTAPKPVPPPGRTDEQGPRVAPLDTQIRVKELKGLVFLTDPQAVKREGMPDVSGVDSSRVPELQTEAFRGRMSRYLGKPVSLASIDTLIRDVVSYYEERDRPFVVVTTPEQDITGGVLQLVVIEGKVGDVRIFGAKTFAENIYRSGIGLKPGDPLSKRQLDAGVEWINKNPFREATVHLTPGSAFGTTDILVRARERPPFRVYGSVDDSGTNLTGNYRMAVGANWGNVLGLDHQLSYQFTADPDVKRFKAHSATYVIPLPWRHLLSVAGSYGEVVGRVPAPFTQQGRSSQVSVRYEMPLPKLGTYTHAFIAGADYKKTNNNLEFGGLSVTAAAAETVQGLVQYRGNQSDSLGTTVFTGSVYYSPGGITSQNNDANYQTLRAFAEADYVYGNLQIQRITRLPLEFSWHSSAEMQFANKNLLGSEQIGLGGYSSVRGYDEREANGDRGFVVRNELRTPAFRHPSGFAGKEAQLQFLAFVDGGAVRSKRLLPGEDRSIEMLSSGIGARFSIDQNVTARVDYGWQLKDSGVVSGRNNSRLHFSLLVSF